jgi:diguanylate cyclase (GGDEF)-like protein
LLTETESETQSGKPSFVLPGTVLLACTAAIWFVLNRQGRHGPLLLGWISPPLALGLAAYALRQTATMPGLAAAGRRFWNQTALVAGTVGIGMVVQAGCFLAGIGPMQATMPLAAAPFYLGGVLYAVWALLRVPIGERSRGAWVRLMLDSATVVLGAAVFLYYFAFGPLLSQGSLRGTWAPLAIGALCLLALSAVIKILLAGCGPVDLDALKLFGLALLSGGLSAGASALYADQPHLVPAQVSVPVISLFVVLAARRQQQALGHGGPPSRPRRWRPMMMLPYVALAATDALLVLATLGRIDERRYAVVAGAIVITAVVATRQVVAYADNARLVDRLRLQEDRLRHQASHDTLTQLANRALFAERLDAALADGAHPDHQPTALLIDLDDFKGVNDTLGHTVGDRLLADVAARIRCCVRPDDTVARLGGDEFAVLLRQSRPDAVEGIAERLLASLAQPVVVDGHELLVQASIGVAAAHPQDDAEMLLRNADIAMYAAKERGKGSYARYVPGMNARILEHAQLGAQLRQALDERQMYLLYQPVVRLSDRRIVGMEALIRWRHPTRGLVGPGDFIPTAERSGLIVPLGRWVLREACRQKAAWRAAHGDDSPSTVGVNVSGRQLREPGFVAEVAAAVHDAGLRPHNLVLEVTETAVLTGGQILQTLQDLHDFGVSLALDDFGTGQSSLGLIRTCPVKILKLDKSFVTDGSTGPGTDQQAAVASAVVQIADALGMDAVAEGIENQEQAEHFQRLGYQLGQGFHLAHPLLPDQLDPLLAGETVRR